MLKEFFSGFAQALVSLLAMTAVGFITAWSIMLILGY